MAAFGGFTIRLVTAFICLALSPAVVCGEASSAETAFEGPVTVYAKRIPQFLDDPVRSPFGKFLQQLESRSGLDLQVTIYPAARATSLFAKGQADLLIPYPVNVGMEEPFAPLGTPVLASDPLAHLFRHFVNLPPEQCISSPVELTALRLGYAMGYEYQLPSEWITDTTLVRATDQASLVAMLYKGRVDAIISFPFEARLVARKLGFSPRPQHDPKFVASQADIVMLMHDSRRGQTLRQIINQTLATLRADGALKELTAAFASPLGP